MPVSNRIKILKCKSFEEAENKVNDFLAFDENITQLVQIDYRLEFNVVIIDYVINGEDKDDEDPSMAIRHLSGSGTLFSFSSVLDDDGVVSSFLIRFPSSLINWPTIPAHLGHNV